ncbi:MAG: TMEM254 family protein [Microthrixaceae bacterium]
MANQVKARPSLLWRLFVLGGVGSMVAISVDDNAWEAVDEMSGGVVDRDVVRAATVGVVGLHMVDSLIAWRSARKAGLERPCRRWAISALLWGFPVLRRVRKARRMEIAAG